jgi:hypothetical protein
MNIYSAIPELFHFPTEGQLKGRGDLHKHPAVLRMRMKSSAKKGENQKTLELYASI